MPPSGSSQSFAYPVTVWFSEIPSYICTVLGVGGGAVSTLKDQPRSASDLSTVFIVYRQKLRELMCLLLYFSVTVDNIPEKSKLICKLLQY